MPFSDLNSMMLSSASHVCQGTALLVCNTTRLREFWENSAGASALSLQSCYEPGSLHVSFSSQDTWQVCMRSPCQRESSCCSDMHVSLTCQNGKFLGQVTSRRRLMLLRYAGESELARQRASKAHGTASTQAAHGSHLLGQSW